MKKSPEVKAVDSATKEYLFLQSRVREGQHPAERAYCQNMADKALWDLNKKRRFAKMPPYGQDNQQYYQSEE